ncbi:hypothetical protein FQA39_LY06684 [Lamprigera yunnana]|nr:hypothetical protein FQA39_LY06684 [Lamprigera yunnana]
MLRKSSASPENPQNLPQLPLPALNDTLGKYMLSVIPLLSQNEFCVTQRLIAEFQCNQVSSVLQNYLEKRRKSTLNWLEEWWLNTAYLGYRDTVVVYSSPGQSMPFQQFCNDEERICYTAKLILAAATYKMYIDSKKMPIEKSGKDQLDMSQYTKLFGTSRIPCSPFYKLKLFSNCKPLSERQVHQQLSYIMSQTCEPDHAIGILTSDQRDKWATAYKDLIRLNGASVSDIQTSLFLVCLDDAMPAGNYSNALTEGLLQFIHGGGSKGNCGNRWFDKTIQVYSTYTTISFSFMCLQFIIGCKGAIGITYEHSPSEGQPIALMVDYIVNFMKKEQSKDIPDNCYAEDPIKLCFIMDDTIKRHIEAAGKSIDGLVKNFKLSCFKFNDYGKDFIKSQKMSPDSYIQMAMQWTFYRLYGKVPAHYESASSRKFVGGRTECIRSASSESLAFAECMSNNCATDNEKIGALKRAIESHKNYANEAMNGRGVDRHLLGLRMAAKELGCEIPEIFKDTAYTRSTNFLLSTSQVATKCDALMSYGPAAEDGYGLCYNPRDCDINFGLSCFASGKTTDIEKFQNCLIDSLIEMQKLLLRNQKSKL